VIGYVVSRLLQAVPVLWVVATVTFVLLRFLPGGPFDREKALPPEILRNIEARYALDRPVLEQYALYLRDVVRGELGPSYKYVGRDVTDVIRDALPVSVVLGLSALAIALLGGVGLGLVAGMQPGSALDRAATLTAVLGVSLPGFVLGPSHVVLPALTLAALPLAYVAQLTRTSVIEVSRQDFVRTARAKGLGELRVRVRHVLRNALLAVVTYFGPLLATLLTGSFVVERIFAIPGLGGFFVTAVTNRDYPLVLGVTLVYAALIVLANLLVDLLYAWLDPRIRLGSNA
jgi:oligopeptide transport system permease protein